MCLVWGMSVVRYPDRSLSVNGEEETAILQWGGKSYQGEKGIHFNGLIRNF